MSDLVGGLLQSPPFWLIAASSPSGFSEDMFNVKSSYFSLDAGMRTVDNDSWRRTGLRAAELRQPSRFMVRERLDETV
jgi:hypothetical protein